MKLKKNQLQKFAFYCLLFSTMASYGQKVGDILEKGIVIKKKESIFLNFKDNKLNYEIGKESSNNFDPLKDSFFLLKSDGISVYLSPPLNPLSFSTSGDIVFSNDEINTGLSTSIGSLITTFSKFITTASLPTPAPVIKGPKGKGGNIPVVSKIIDTECQTKGKEILTALGEISDKLNIDKKLEITSLFGDLKGLDFVDKGVTKTKLDAINKKIQLLNDYNKSISDMIEKTKKITAGFVPCKSSDLNEFTISYVINETLKKEELLLKEKESGLKNLVAIYDTVSSVCDNSVGSDKNWAISLGRVSMEEDKIATYKVVISADGYSLIKGEEITKTAKKSIVEGSLKFRKFQHWVPEISAGIVFTSLKFPKFTAATDASTGITTVKDAGEDEFKKINITGMLNMNYFVENSNAHPFFQIGVGEKTDYPTLLLGVGVRISSKLNRLAISTGFAGTWIKKPSTLKIGDVISDSSVLEKDYIYEFSFPLKPYLGLQYNF